MKKNLSQILLIGGACLLAVGCSNIGNSPAGETPDEVKADVQKQPPLQQIRSLMFAPIPPAQKEDQIKAIEQKFGVKREDAMKDLPPPKFDLNTKPPEAPTGK